MVNLNKALSWTYKGGGGAANVAKNKTRARRVSWDEAK